MMIMPQPLSRQIFAACSLVTIPPVPKLELLTPASARICSSTFSTRLNTIFRECVTGYDYAQNLVVIHTLPGLANAAASAIDAMSMSVVLGTLAGDDTVMIVMRDTNAAAQFCGEIKQLTS